MPSGRGARASVSSSDAERSSYRTTFIGPSATGGSAGLDAVAEDVALGFFGRAHLLVEVVEVRQRLPDDARLDQLADLVAVQRVDGALLLDQLRHRARELGCDLAVAEELPLAHAPDVVVRWRHRIAGVYRAGVVEVVRDGENAPVEGRQQHG